MSILATESKLFSAVIQPFLATVTELTNKQLLGSFLRALKLDDVNAVTEYDSQITSSLCGFDYLVIDGIKVI